MKHLLHDGIPLEHDYKKLIDSNIFRSIEGFSNNFLSTNSRFIQNYANKWVMDPLHQWSRQWEYPFVYSRFQQIIQHESKPSILDAGSGVTFFPYYLNTKYDITNIHCCDYDKTLEKIFEQINIQQNSNVEFLAADLRSLPYENESFHMIYCISVLEHTNDYEKIIDEFYRILRPGGSLIVTFDISLDRTRDIDVDSGNTLLTSLERRFDAQKMLSLDLHSHVSNPDIFTTLTANNIDGSLLPWKLPAFLYRFKCFISTGHFGSWPPPLTVFCLSLTKPA